LIGSILALPKTAEIVRHLTPQKKRRLHRTAHYPRVFDLSGIPPQDPIQESGCLTRGLVQRPNSDLRPYQGKRRPWARTTDPMEDQGRTEGRKCFSEGNRTGKKFKEGLQFVVIANVTRVRRELGITTGHRENSPECCPSSSFGIPFPCGTADDRVKCARQRRNLRFIAHLRHMPGSSVWFAPGMPKRNQSATSDVTAISRCLPRAA
jgi:hypothetical protein